MERFRPIAPTPIIVTPAADSSNIRKGFSTPTAGISPAVSGRNTPEPLLPNTQLDFTGVDGKLLSATGKPLREQSLRNVQDLFDRERGDDKEYIHMVVIGHVDAGKSTLMGHMLVDLGEISQRVMHKNEQESRKLGKQSFMYAWVLDETGEERQRGITMDVGSTRFSTTSKIVSVRNNGFKLL